MPIKFPGVHKRSQQAADDSRTPVQTLQQPQIITADNNDINARHYDQGESPKYTNASNNESFSASRPVSHSQSEHYSTIYSSPPEGRFEASDDSASIDERGDNGRFFGLLGSSATKQPQQPDIADSKKRRFGSGWLSKGKDKDKDRDKGKETDKEKPNLTAPSTSTLASQHSNNGGLGRHASTASRSGPQVSAASQNDKQIHSDRQYLQYPYLATRSSELHLPSPLELGAENNPSHQSQASQSLVRSPGIPQSHSISYDLRQTPTGVSRSGTEVSLLGNDQNSMYTNDDQSKQNSTQQQYQQRSAQQQDQQYSQKFEDKYVEHRLPALPREAHYGHEIGTTDNQIASQSDQSSNLVAAHAALLAAQDLQHPSFPVREQRSGNIEDDIIDLDTAVAQVSKFSSIQPSRSPSLAEPRSEHPGIAPSAALLNMNRRSTDAKSALSGDARGLPAYSQQFSAPQPSPGLNSPQGVSPNTSQPMGARQLLGSNRDLGESGQGARHPDTIELEKLHAKYKKVKALYFEKVSQVEQLQNSVANQRLSSSRTSLDDSEYSQRFTRLDGAIKELAFSVRKDWDRVPNWLHTSVNADARQIGTKEMTAVGRASISKWLYDEIFCKCFHPGLNTNLSADLRKLELNIRHFASKPTNPEEESALSNKVVQWKLTTIDALADRLVMAEAVNAKNAYTKMAIENLTAHLMVHMKDSITPSALEGSATSIIEIAVGICTHLASESREIAIALPLPGDPPNATSMKVETGLPDLETSIDKEMKAVSNDTEDEKSAPQKHQAKQDSVGGNNSSDAMVRFAGFMSVDIQGKHSLYQSPVWLS